MGRQSEYSQAIALSCGQVHTLRDGEKLSGKLVHDFACDDAIKIIARANAMVSYCTIADTLGSKDEELREKAHRDCIQIIPAVFGKQRQQYALAETVNITINDNHLFGCGTAIQGIFASDGIHRDLSIIGNLITGSNSQHKITINGLISGTIVGNYGDDGLAQIQLDPARICNGLYILSFKDEDDDYQSISDIVRDESLHHVVDNRRKITRPNDTYLIDFDLSAYREAVLEITADDIGTYCEKIKALALNFGERIYSA